MKQKYLIVILFFALFSCAGDGEDNRPVPTNEMVGTAWKWKMQQDGSTEIYSALRFKNASTLEIWSNLNDERIEKLQQTYSYEYNENTKTVTYAMTERPFCEGKIAGDSMVVTCGIQRLFTRMP
ncbi:hypothetical protein [Dyadobacter luticola]|uniref:Lipocalin-like domain-containing protein n=1 Tax=Dyadobacter luticola TaxID=1979387 RepID=A0A5R9L4Q3_9BACT|nr:hypothetical protein [Dyadobacter luticola]TLV03391.1 hypothetical protein FEN17_07225 [Dyadobacter luticola]